MKNLLLLLFVVLNFSAYAFGPSIIVHCGPGTANLTTNADYFIGSQNPQDVVLFYFTSQIDAETNTNPIPLPQAYFIPATMTVYVRIENTATSTITYDFFEVFVEAPMTVTIAPSNDFPPSQLIATPQNGTPPYLYTWQINGGAMQSNSTGWILLPNTAGTLSFSVFVTDANGCTASTWFIYQQSWVHAYNDDIYIPLSGSDVSVSTISILDNDVSGSAPILPNQVQITSSNLPTGFSFNNDGTINVLPGTPAGDYTFSYTICEALEGTCSTATATVHVISDGLLLHAFVDSNDNGVQDTGEQNFALGQFHYDLNNSGNITTVTSSTGSYLINESNPANSYDFSFTIDSDYAAQYNLTTASYANISYVSGITAYNFPVTEVPFNDLSIVIYNFLNGPRPGFTYKNNVVYTNNGTQPMSGTVTFTHDNLLSISSVSQSGTVATGNGFTYDFTNLLPHQSRNIIVTMQVPTIPTVALGGLLTNTVSVTTPPDDIIPENNASTITQMIVGSYDPNEKTESHGGKIVFADFAADDFLTYTIQFENTGTFSAENVKVVDVLDSQLDETSVRMLNASSEYTLAREGNMLTWHLNGIDLPPSVTDTEIGHGYVTFKVKPKPGFALGDIIPNTASIYFDFNPPIVTIPCLTQFVNTLTTDGFTFGALRYYPNPVKNTLTISNNSPIDSIVITSVLGQEVLRQTANTTEVDLSKLADGIYFVKATSGKQTKTFKIIKE